MIVQAPTHWIGAGAVTVFPFIFVSPRFRNDAPTLTHEMVHWQQQKRWAIYGLGVGLLVWFFLYLFVLPVYWNPFRRRCETEAYTTNGCSPEYIDTVLRGAPYFLRR